MRIATMFVLLIEYVPILLTISLATIVAATTTSPNAKQGVLLQWVVVLLGLIATSILVERVTRLRRMDTAVANINELFASFMAERIRATDFYVDDLPSLQKEVESASNIMIMAVNGQAFLVEHKNALAERVREGAELKVVVVDPSSESARRIANPDKELPVEYIQATAQIARQTLAWIDRQRQGSGAVELRYCDFIPVFAGYAFDRTSHRGRMAIGLYRQFWNHERRPHAILSKLHDGYWYDYYCAQMEEAWDRGSVIQLTAGERDGE